MFSASEEIEMVNHRFQESLYILKLGQESAADCSEIPPPPLPETATTSGIINCPVTHNMHVNFIMKS